MPALRPLTTACTVLALLTALPAGAQTVEVHDINSGAYLAARQAAMGSDFRAATEYFAKAMRSDPGNPVLLESALSSYVALGDIDTAADVARRMIQDGTESQLANMVLLGRAAASGDWDGMLADLDAGQSVGPLFDDLLRGWALLGDGQVTESLAQFDKVIGEEGVGAFGYYHKAMALASVGDFEGAEAIFSGRAAGGEMRLNRWGVIGFAQVLSQLDRNADAVDLLQKSFAGTLDDALADLRHRLEAGEQVPFTAIRSPADGVAEVYLSIAGALGGEANDAYTLLYARMTQYLRPEHVEGLLMVAALLDRLEQHDLAIEAYRKVPRDDPAFAAAELGRAEALVASDRIDAAIEVLQQLTELQPENPMIFTTLGDTLRGQERFPAASEAYDKAIALFDEDAQSQWLVYFARAITFERTDQWDKAEADFRKALELNPDQPQVLNYLGYSYVEKGENLDEALDMIQRAVAALPDSGYITDSLGWVYYQLGRYADAVEPMERAVELEPVDAVVNDHLGDVYWAVGRRLEAEFQWHRALSFAEDAKSTDADPARIRRKLEVGLDQVLRDEGKEPLNMANDGG